MQNIGSNQLTTITKSKDQIKYVCALIKINMRMIFKHLLSGSEGQGKRGKRSRDGSRNQVVWL